MKKQGVFEFLFILMHFNKKETGIKNWAVNHSHSIARFMQTGVFNRSLALFIKQVSQ